jgi:hypothetical protein
MITNIRLTSVLALEALVKGMNVRKRRMVVLVIVLLAELVKAAVFVMVCNMKARTGVDQRLVLVLTVPLVWSALDI